MANVTTKPRSLFNPDEMFSPEEVGERLKASHRQVRRWIEDGRFPNGGVIELPRGRRIWGWALNEFVASRTLGA